MKRRLGHINNDIDSRHGGVQPFASDRVDAQRGGSCRYVMAAMAQFGESFAADKPGPADDKYFHD